MPKNKLQSLFNSSAHGLTTPAEYPSMGEFRTFLIKGLDEEEFLNFVVDQQFLHSGDREPLSKRTDIAIVAYVDDEIDAAAAQCMVDDVPFAIVREPDLDAKYLLEIGDEPLNPYKEGAAQSNVSNWLRSLPERIARSRLDEMLAILRTTKHASNAIYYLGEIERVIASYGYDEAVDEACHSLHLMAWALDVPSGGDERVYAVHFDGNAILNDDEGVWWCEPIEDLWLSVLDAESEVELTGKKREDYAEWTAKLRAARAAYAQRQTT